VLLLRLKGYRIRARNWRCSLGEIDIVAEQRSIIVFVEVKSRRSTSAGVPEEAVTRSKQERLVRLAQLYLQQLRGPARTGRFDVIAIEPGRLLPRIRHIRDAFRADGLA
jgi:putative endonuclease